MLSRVTRTDGGLVWRWVAVVGMLAIPGVAGVAATGEGAHGHTHGAGDDRPTPASAATHETGTLPPASGRNSSAASEVEFTIDGEVRQVTANGMPDHATGRFPNRGNPNVIAEQSYAFRMPLDPAPPAGPIEEASQVRRDRGYLFGIAVNGVVFEPATGLNWTAEGLRRGGRPGGWVHEAIGGSIDFGVDHANAHIQRTGAYHYHGVPVPLLRDDRPTLVGYAADGYPIYGPLGYKDPADAGSALMTLQSSWRLKEQARPEPPTGPGGMPDGRYTADWEYVSGSGDLDRLNGRFAVTPEYPDGVYHYVLTETFPHVPRGFAGTPDRSFHRTPGQGPNHVTQRGERLDVGQREEAVE